MAKTKRCPICGRLDFELDNGVWRCLWKDCGYQELCKESK